MNFQRPVTKQPILNYITIGKIVTLVVASGFLFLASCASNPNTPPPPGSAIIDVKPDPEFRMGVGGIALVSINGGKVKGTRSVIKPGLNTIKVRFNWSQGKNQQADLRFYATRGTVYTVHYDVYPSPGKFESHLAEGFIDNFGAGGVGSAFFAPLAGVMGLGERIAHVGTRNQSTHIDLMVFGGLSGGMARKIRVYPDGRVVKKPWNSWAQMKDPRKRQLCRSSRMIRNQRTLIKSPTWPGSRG